MIDVSNVCYYCGNQSIPNFRYNGVKVCPEHAPADEKEQSELEQSEAEPEKPPVPDFYYYDPNNTMFKSTSAAIDYSKSVSVKFITCPTCNPDNKAAFVVNYSCKQCDGSGFIVI